MTVRRTAARSLGVLALAAPVVLGLAPSAMATTGPATFDSVTPASGAVFTGSDTDVTVSATLPACTKASFPNSGCASTVTSTLTLAAPGQTGQSVTKKSTTSAQSMALTIPAGSPNAVWTVTLTGATSRSFTIDQANAPESFSADGSGSRDVAFAWNKGSESGIIGYVLANSNGSIIDDTITPDSANCASTSRCTYGLYYPSDNPGSHGYQLVAKRTSSSGGSVTSAAATANATLTQPPKPTPSPTPSATAGPATSPAPGGGGSSTTGGSSTGTTGGTAPGGTTGTAANGSSSTGGTIDTGGTKPTLPPSAVNPVLAGRKAFALTFNAFSPSLGIPKLPPLPATDLPSLSGEAPLPIGTYKPSLPYQSQTETTSTRSLLSSPTAFVETITDPEQLAKSIAGALILLLIGAHLRRFLGAHVED